MRSKVQNIRLTPPPSLEDDTTRAATVVGALALRAEVLAFKGGHFLGDWEPAKQKHGVGALRAHCIGCGGWAWVLPFGDKKAKAKLVKDAPGIKGEILSIRCRVAD